MQRTARIALVVAGVAGVLTLYGSYRVHAWQADRAAARARQLKEQLKAAEQASPSILSSAWFAVKTSVVVTVGVGAIVLVQSLRK